MEVHVSKLVFKGMHEIYMGVSNNRGVSPKMDGL